MIRSPALHPPSPRGEAAAPPPLTRWQIRVLKTREAKLARFAALVARGLTRRAADAETRFSTSTRLRLLQLVRDHGPEGLIPKPIRGRPPLIAPAVFTPAVVRELQRQAVRLGGPNAAARSFAKDPKCPRVLARYIRARGSLPERLRALVGYGRVKRAVRFAGQHVHVEGAGMNQIAA